MPEVLGTYGRRLLSTQVHIIAADKIKVSKAWGGGLSYTYRCPKCKEALSSSNEQALLSDTCPTCSASFILCEEVQAFWRQYKERQRQEDDDKRRAQEEQRQKSAAKRAAAARQAGQVASTAVNTVRSQFEAVRSSQFVSSTSLLDIFDWRFKKYLTPWILRATWLIVLLVAALWVLYQSFSFMGAWLPEMGWDTGVANDFAGRPQREVSREPVLPFWFQLRAMKSLLAVTKIAATAIVMLWIRVAFEVAIVLFNIATALTAIEADVRKHTQSADGTETN